MRIIEFFVDDRSYDTEDGYTLYIDDPEELAMAVKTAIKNGFTDIRISLASKKDLAESNLYNKTNFDIDKQL